MTGKESIAMPVLTLPLIETRWEARVARPVQQDATYVEGCDTYVRSPITTDTLDRRLEKLARANAGSADSAVRLNVDNGTVALGEQRQEGDNVLPLRLGAMQKAFGHIREGDPWLLDRNPVFYVDGQGKAHIDYTNLAGFVVDPIGTIVSRSVNPW